MQVVRTIAELQDITARNSSLRGAAGDEAIHYANGLLRSARNDRLGFVPTMGALHAGHISLVERARSECDRVCVSIFVNPLQFGPNEDFNKYPRTTEADLALLKAAQVDIVWLPSVEDIYPSGTSELIKANSELANRLCGKSRPGHFDGVCTVVNRLFDAVQPDRAYFGEKDYQQLIIIRDMVKRLNIPVEVIACPIMREADGLAMSSRNRYLSEEERKLAPELYKSLQVIASNISHVIASPRSGRSDPNSMGVLRFAQDDEYLNDALANLKSLGFKVDYLESHWNRLFIAAKLGGTRLIDNIELR